MNELTHLFNFKRSVVCNQISPKHVHDTSASRSIFFAINAQIVLKFSPYLARSSPIIFHTKILPIGSKYLHIADICSPKQNCTPDRRPFHLEATAASYRHALRSNAITQKVYYTIRNSLPGTTWDINLSQITLFTAAMLINNCRVLKISQNCTFLLFSHQVFLYKFVSCWLCGPRK